MGVLLTGKEVGATKKSKEHPRKKVITEHFTPLEKTSRVHFS
jgi:hypothetical protein